MGESRGLSGGRGLTRARAGRLPLFLDHQLLLEADFSFLPEACPLAELPLACLVSSEDEAVDGVDERDLDLEERLLLAMMEERSTWEIAGCLEDQ